jgi:hypothetical protein
MSNNPGSLRAVKKVRKRLNFSSAIDYNRELEAVAKFSHIKVSWDYIGLRILQPSNTS